MKNYVNAGEHLTIPAPYNAASGTGVKSGSIFGIAQFDVVAPADIVVVRKGVFAVAKVSAQAWAVGAKIYWDDAAKLFTTVATSNLLVGVATAAATNPSGTGEVLLTGQVV